MTFNEYQEKALKTNLAKEDIVREFFQQTLGLADEVGEVLAIFKKWVRDCNADISKLDVSSVKKEMGDVLWYLAVIAHDLGLSFDDIAAANIEKLADRQERGVLSGSGDNR